MLFQSAAGMPGGIKCTLCLLFPSSQAAVGSVFELVEGRAAELAAAAGLQASAMWHLLAHSKA